LRRRPETPRPARGYSGGTRARTKLHLRAERCSGANTDGRTPSAGDPSDERHRGSRRVDQSSASTEPVHRNRRVPDVCRPRAERDQARNPAWSRSGSCRGIAALDGDEGVGAQHRVDQTHVGHPVAAADRSAFMAAAAKRMRGQDVGNVVEKPFRCPPGGYQVCECTPSTGDRRRRVGPSLGPGTTLTGRIGAGMRGSGCLRRRLRTGCAHAVHVDRAQPAQLGDESVDDVPRLRLGLGGTPAASSQPHTPHLV